MEIANILVNSTTGRCLTRKQIPARLVGGTVSVEFADSIWDRLNKTVVFRCEQSQPAEFDGKTAVIPWELLQQPGKRLYFGIWGNDPASDLQIPLIEVPIGVVEASTDPDATPGADPTLPIWAQLQNEIEDLKKAGVSEEKIAQVVEEYLKKNPPTVTETDPTVPDWAKNEKKPTYTADEVGALSKEELSGAVSDALAQAKASGEFDGEPGAPGQDYVLTEDDKIEIAEMAAGLVEIPDFGGNVAYDEAQNLTDEQKAQARENIGAQPKGNYLDSTELNNAINTALAQAKESGEFDGEDGKDGVVAVTGATVGQTVKISAVDENGVPTAWESVDFPSGGSEEVWEEIASVTVTEDITGLRITEDSNGQPLNLKKCTIYMRLRGNSSGSTGWINMAAAGARVTSLPSGFALTEGQDNYYNVLMDVKVTEIETRITGYRSDNATSTKTQLRSTLCTASSLVGQSDHGEYIDKIEFICNGASMGANTEIFVYGVRA